ncbi:NERD domain-containing protein [Actinomadura sp. WMMB 499]|nr:NERD domain-containing protein [Actinomadura sp. WMMB 499]
MAGGTLLAAGLLVSGVFGIALALLVAGADTFVHWRIYRASRVWRLGLRGEERMGRLLRLTRERRGHRVLHARTVPGHGTADQLVIGSDGLWLVHNEAWHPDAELSHHGGRLFVDGRTKTKLVREITARAEAAADLISAGAGTPVKVRPLLAVHGGEMPRRARLFTADGIVFGTPARLLRYMSRNPSADYTADEIDAIMRAAVLALPIGGRQMTAAA